MSEEAPARPLLDRLGVKPGAKVLLASDYDRPFVGLLRGCVKKLARSGEGPFDIVFLQVDARAELSRLRQLERALAKDGAIWVTRRKGPERSVREVDVIEAAIAAGLVDNKIASFSEELAAMRLVIPLSRR